MYRKYSPAKEKIRTKRRLESMAFTKMLQKTLMKRFDLAEDQVWVRKWNGSWKIATPETPSVKEIAMALYKELSWPDLNKIGEINNVDVRGRLEEYLFLPEDSISQTPSPIHIELPKKGTHFVTKVKTLETKYVLEKGDIKIHVIKDNQGRLTIANHKEVGEFIFSNSDPDMVKTIGELLIEASKLR